MNKKRKIDFVLDEDEDCKTIFRFYPRQSSCHSFGDKPPTKWEEVYKVYYSYKILKIYDDNTYEILYDCECDECSRIDDVAATCKYLAEGKVEIVRTNGNESWTIKLLDNVIHPWGYGTSWTIKERKYYYEFELFNWNNIGYKFILPKEEMKKFGDYLEYCCEYMLAHGDPI